MADWQRLADLVVARRTELGYTNRDDLADKAGVSARTIGDIEVGRKEKYFRSILSRIEKALLWQTGSIDAVLDGGNPTEAAGHTETHDPLLIEVMRRDDLTDDQKKRIVEILLIEKARAERARAEHAEQLIDMARNRD